MTTPLLATKTFMPATQPDSVARPDLLARLNAGLNGQLTLVSAPAGSGKSTLVTEWVHQLALPVAWLSLDSNDSDPSRFLRYVLAAIRTCKADFGDTLVSLLESMQTPPDTAIMSSFINAFTQLPGRLLLVLDDFHLVESTEVDDALKFLIDHLPTQLHLVIVSREDPEMPLARLRAQGQLSEIRAVDLKFSTTESQAFFSRNQNLALSADDVALIVERTEGWVAGLQLAALSVKGETNPHLMLQNFTGRHHFVLDYLAEEIFQKLPEDLLNFLLKTSVLNRLSVDLCAALLGSDQASARRYLEQIQRMNLFLIPLDKERQWFRYHHLFADMLQQRLLHQYSTVDVQALHLRASVWYQQQSDDIEAFWHAGQSNDMTQVLPFLDRYDSALMYRGGATAVLNWIESLPTSAFARYPQLEVHYASVLSILGKNTALGAQLDRAALALKQRPTDADMDDLRGQVETLRARQAATLYDSDAVFAHATDALALLHDDNIPMRTAALHTLALAYQYRDQRSQAEEAYQKVMMLSQETGNLFIQVMAATGLGILHEQSLVFASAEQQYYSVVEKFADQPIACEAYLGLARISYLQNRLDDAKANVMKAIQLAQYIENIDTALAGEMLRCRLVLAEDNRDGLLESLANLEKRLYSSGFTNLIPELRALQIRQAYSCDDLAALGSVMANVDEPIVVARFQLANQDFDTPLTTLSALAESAEADHLRDRQLQVYLLLTRTYAAVGQQELATVVLKKAIELAEPAHNVRSFLDEGRDLLHLLLALEGQVANPVFLLTLTQTLEQTQYAQESTSETISNSRSPNEALTDPLSKRELEVLALIAQGYSNSDISERLFLALSTIKGHNQIIFEKLQVKRRTEAVAKARELGLI